MSANPENLSSARGQAEDPRLAAVNRVLTGEGGQPANPVAATTMYRQLLGQGVGAAAERLAVLAAVGVSRSANWQEAVGWLVKGADLGDASCRKQIGVLAGQEPADQEDPHVEGAWLQLARSIDMKWLLKAPVLTKRHESPAIALIEGLATPPMCGWLIRRAEERLAPAMIGDYATGRGVVDPIRTGLAAGFGLADTDVVFVMTQKRLELASGLKIQQQEAPFVLSYEPGQEYKAHFDFFAPGEPAFQETLKVMGQRVGTCLTWLNDDYDGGETAFPKIDWKHKGKAGDAMLFLNVRTGDRAPDPKTLHAGLPVIRGRKWMLSQWVRDRALPIV
jgi:prolyl 4-hydroxylase